MNYLILQLQTVDNTETIISISKIIEYSVNALFISVSLLGSAYLAYRYAIKRIKRETPLLMQRELYNKKLNALQDYWKLLQYSTDNENKKSILIYEKTGNKPKQWFFNPQNAKELRNEISGFFYGKGAGIFISQELKDLLFEYDRQIYGILLSEKDSKEDFIAVKNNKLAERLIDIHKQMLEKLKQEIHNLPKIIESGK